MGRRFEGQAGAQLVLNISQNVWILVQLFRPQDEIFLKFF